MATENIEAQYKELDGQIESLMKCTPLPEAEVKVLCEKAKEILEVWATSASFKYILSIKGHAENGARASAPLLAFKLQGASNFLPDTCCFSLG